MKIILVSKCSLDIEQYVEFKMLFWYLPQRASLARAGSQMCSLHREKKGDTAAVSGSWKLPLPAPATSVAKNQCLTCCLTCCFWCWISHWVLLILSWNMWLRGRSGGLWLGRDPGGVGGSVKIGDWVFDLVGVFPWLRSFGLTFRLLVLREYSYLGVYLSAVTIWSMPFVLVSCC